MCAAPHKTVCGNVRGTAENCKAQVSPKSTTVRIDFVRQRTAGQFAAPSTTNAVCGNVRGTAENCKARQVNSLHYHPPPMLLCGSVQQRGSFVPTELEKLW